MLSDNLAKVKERVAAAALKANRDVNDITLIAVSKTKPVEMVQEIYDLGIREFGENKVQEIVMKAEVMPDDINWHMIGHLQRNKVKQVIQKACMIHSVDSIRLAEEISKQATNMNITVPILLEVNVAREESKFGFTTDDIYDAFEYIANLPGIFIRGLMTSAPFVDNPEDNRVYFKELRQLCVDLKAKNKDNTCMDILSMGMTNDYEIAIEEGATHIRVGTAIFGERIYSV